MSARTTGYAFLQAMVITLFVVDVVSAQETPEQIAAGLRKEAERLYDAGQYKAGIDLAKRSLALREKALGPEHPDVAASLQTLGKLYDGSGRYDLAQSNHQRALALREKVLGLKHPDVGWSCVYLAHAYSEADNWSKAEELYERALAIFDNAPGVRQAGKSRALSGLAAVYTQTVAYDRAEPLFERALAIEETVSGPESAATAVILDAFAGMYATMGSYARAERMFRRALAIQEKVKGSEHTLTALKLSNLATAVYFTGAYADAERLYKRALVILEAKLGPEHPYTLRALSNLAELYSETGAYSRAEELQRRVVAVQRRVLSGVRSDLSISLANLGRVYSAMGRFELAEPLCVEALKIAEVTYGVEHPYTAGMVGVLGNLYRRKGEYSRAESLLKKSVHLYEVSIGPKHSDTAGAIRNLADLYSDRGKSVDASRLYQRALTIYESALGSEHPDTISALRSVAMMAWARGKRSRALSLMQQVQQIQAKNADRFLASGSEIRKQDYQRALINNAFEEVSFAMSTPGAAAASLGMNSVLQTKGRVLDAVSDNVTRLRRSVAPTDQSLLEQLADIASQLSALTYGQAGPLSPDQYRQRLTQLSAQQDQLEANLASRSQAFRRQIVPVTLDNVSRAIPANAALVEWFRYIPFDPTQKSPKLRQGAPRYVAYVLKRNGQPVAVDMGEARAIEMLAQRLRVALAHSDSNDVKQHAAALSAKILLPLYAQLKGVEHILFSPDGDLNLVPLAALLDESGSYLAEHFEVSYLTSGRDLLRIAQDSSPPGSAVVVADPSYGKPSVPAAVLADSFIPQRSPELDRSGLVFRPLAGTALEAQDLKRLLKLNVSDVLLQQDASEARLKLLRSPGILHIASHGFFLNDQQLSEELRKRSGSGSESLAASENPLLRSGIALAGANERRSGADDGILTALEVTQLDLSNTQLVVLSACDTGVGTVQNGEGVYGLRRALALAGAQTQITSLWKVSDDATRYLMVDYYRRLQQGEGRAAALARTQRSMLVSAKFSHPYYWASFIPIGNWNPLPRL